LPPDFLQLWAAPAWIAIVEIAMNTKLKRIVEDAKKLSSPKLRALIDELWDVRIERDVHEGRLDTLAEEALAEHKAGKTRLL
jgi:hypothetical protein